nr:MAG TPA: hypothetical protein [Caudoviricetes sp.]
MIMVISYLELNSTRADPSGRCKEHVFNVGMLSNALGHVPIYQDGNASTHGRTQVSLQQIKRKHTILAVG